MDNEITKTTINTSEKLDTRQIYFGLQSSTQLRAACTQLSTFLNIFVGTQENSLGLTYYGDQPIFVCWSVSTSLSLKGVNII